MINEYNLFIIQDGSKKCVGRVSVVDESGEQIIMDDYIAGIDGEIVHDYLTQYR